jgi:hypothetical protein
MLDHDICSSRGVYILKWARAEDVNSFVGSPLKAFRNAIVKRATLRRIQDNDEEANRRHRRMLVYISYECL